MSCDLKSSVKMKPKPPPSLNRENFVIWRGWTSKGDKEVAREAAAKAAHVDLAIIFISIRRQISLEEAEAWLKNEVIEWALEMLDQKQFFKPSRVLEGIGLNPSSEIGKVLYITENQDLREYIVCNMLRTRQLNTHLRDLWNFFNVIFSNKNLVPNFHLENNSLKSLDNVSKEKKEEIASILFFSTEDNRLTPFLTSEAVWKYLVANDDKTNLRLWINIQFVPNFKIIESNIVKQFKRLTITGEMLDEILNNDFENTDLGNAVYNELSKFGIFRKNELDNVIVILERLSNSFSLGNVYNILGTKLSVLPVKKFIKSVISYCLDKELYSILNVSVKDFILKPDNSQELKLICDFRLLVRRFDEDLLSRNIFDISSIFAKDLIQYFNENPLLLLALILFTKDVLLIDLLTKNSALTVYGASLNDCLPTLVKKYPIIKIICNKTNNVNQCNLSIYDLVTKHLDVHSKYLFKFRCHDKEFPHFSCREMVKEYGYSKTLNYKLYLKQSRPCIAAKKLVSGVNKIERKVVKLAITYFQCDEITATCVAFMELIGLNSLKLRVLIRAAKMLLKGNTKNYVLEVLLNSSEEPYILQNSLETFLMSSIQSSSLSTGAELVEAFRLYDIVVQYSKANELKLPELFLRYCASSNLWLPFLIFVQINNYPVEQIKLLIQLFKSPNIIEHLEHGIVDDIIQTEQKSPMNEKGLQKYTEIRQHIDDKHVDNKCSLDVNDSIEIDIYNLKATLLQTLIRCHNSRDPPRALLQACEHYHNPFLAVVATIYEPDSRIINWLTWLAVSCELCDSLTSYDSVAISPSAVTDLLENCLKNRYSKALLESFQIFLPDNPLKKIVEIINSLIKFDFSTYYLEMMLIAFRSKNKDMQKNPVFNTDPEMTYLHNRIWIETTALKLLSAVLDYNCDSVYQQIMVVENLNRLEIWKYFFIECPNFINIHKILKILYEDNCDTRLNFSIIFDTQERREAVMSCINSLLKVNNYQTVLKIAQIENIRPDCYLIEEFRHKMNYENDTKFWLRCNQIFVEKNITADCVVDFYADCAEKMLDLFNKFTLMKFAYEWASRFELSCQYEIEQKMWLAFLVLDEKQKDLDSFTIKSEIFLYKNLEEKLKNLTEYKNELNQDFIRQLELLLNRILSKGNFWLALKLQKMFHIKSTEMEVLKICHNLAEGTLLPHQLKAEQRLLLSNVESLRIQGHRRPFLSSRLSSVSSSSYGYANCSSIETLNDATQSTTSDVLTTLRALSEYLQHGSKIAQNIFMIYRISVNTGIPYHAVIVTSNYMDVLKNAIDENCSNKLDVVHDFLHIYKWSKEESTSFVCEELIMSANRYTTYPNCSFIMWDIDMIYDFHLVLQLLQDCSLLGRKLFSYADSFHKSHTESTDRLSPSVLLFIIELIIKAHDCFTADCNMEGISTILKKSKEIISSLVRKRSWKLVVRLLTGVGRYTEMNYVFHILKENDSFEYLLHRTIRKDNGLKVALLDYLKKYCPDNHELYKIVALHFTLFSEVAVLWENEAKNIINNLITISKLQMQNNKLDPDSESFILFQNNEGTKINLTKAMENYTHATEFHLQGEKLSSALNSSKQAELIALQLGILKTVPEKGFTECLLNLSGEQVSTLISTKLSFEQSLILTETYDYRINWASALFHQYVRMNNNKYFECFLQHVTLTDAIVQDISRKFIDFNITTAEGIQTMKNILRHSSSLHVKYRIASELGFTDLIEELVSNEQLVYLKDTVWKKGYKG